MRARRHPAHDGYRPWLKYDRVAGAGLRQQYQARFVASPDNTPVLCAASAELRRGLGGLLGQAVPALGAAGTRAGGIVLRVGTAGNGQLCPEGYRIFPENNNLEQFSGYCT